MPKVTSEQLLDLFGLKVGDIFWLRNKSYRYRIDKDSSSSIVVYDFGLGRYFKFNQFIFDYDLIGSEYEIIKPKPTLTEDEKVILRNIDEKFEWIARAKNPIFGLMLFRIKPIKDGDVWNDSDYSGYPSIFDHLFQFITWEDEEPYNIEELLKGDE